MNYFTQNRIRTWVGNIIAWVIDSSVASRQTPGQQLLKGNFDWESESRQTLGMNRN